MRQFSLLYQPHYLDSKHPSKQGLKAEPEKLAGEAVDAKVDGTVEEDAELDNEEEDLNVVPRVVLETSNLKIKEIIYIKKYSTISWF